MTGWESPLPTCLVEPAGVRGVFDRVLCGVDETAKSLEAVRQADVLREAAGSLTVVAAVELSTAAQAGWAAGAASAQIEAEAQLALDAARVDAPEALLRRVEGAASQVLLAEVERLDATLLAVGTRGISRPVGIALGSVTTTVVHDALCSVLVARERPVREVVPHSIVVEIDGSPESAAAAAVAFAIGARFGVDVWPVAAMGGRGADSDAVDEIATGVVRAEGHPVDALIGTATAADLLVVGSRGLHGVRALGSVSERVVHQAPCSVLVVRPPTTP